MHKDEDVHRVKYFPRNDLACGMNIEKIEELYNSQKTTPQDINDAIEFYNLFLYFHDKQLVWKKWSSEQVDIYKKFTETLKNSAFSFIATLDDSSFKASVKIINFIYLDDLIPVVQMATKFHNITETAIKELLENNDSFIYYAVKNEDFVNHYGKVIKDFLISHNSAEIIISAEDSKNNDTVSRTYIPKCLSKTERDTILENYINSSDVNPTYLSLLIAIPFEKKLPITLHVSAKKKLEEIQKTMLSSAGRICTFNLHFEKGQEEKAIIINQDAFSIDISYSLDWILNHLTYDSIFYNFVDMFCFVDGQYRIMNMNKPIDAGLIDSISMMKNNKIYQKNIIFEFYEGLLNHELFVYRNVLLNNGIFLEKMVETFFSGFIVENYSFPKIVTNLPIDNRTYFYKCQALVTNIDFIGKQFYHFVKYGKIDKELLLADNTPVKIENIPSLLKHKYVHGCGNNYKGMVYALFSNQCLLNYIQSKKIQYECFYDLLEKETIYKSDYPEYEHSTLEELKKWDLIEIDDNGLISLKNLNRIFILRDLYRNQFSNFNRFDEELKAEILEMEKLGLIEFENTLLSKEEAAYINYYLNETFPNGPKLRNQYAHGALYVEDDENVHFNNYIILLRLLILLTLKINDDICLYHSIIN